MSRHRSVNSAEYDTFNGTYLFTGAIHYNKIGLHDNNEKSRNKQKTLVLTISLNPNPMT